MRQGIKDFAAIVARTLPIAGPVYDFGSLQVPGQAQFADLRPIFPTLEYVGADMRMGTGVDVLLDLHRIGLPSSSIGTALCLDTLEHVEFPHLAVVEMHRVLRNQGVLVISSVMDFPIHEHPHDYWRFSPQGFRSLLAPFRSAFVGFAGRPEQPHTVVGVGFKGEAPPLEEFTKGYLRWQAAMSKPGSLREYARLALPPFLYAPIARLSRRLRPKGR
jgi:SAM-dependent methyltransferase